MRTGLPKQVDICPPPPFVIQVPPPLPRVVVEAESLRYLLFIPLCAPEHILVMQFCQLLCVLLIMLYSNIYFCHSMFQKSPNNVYSSSLGVHTEFWTSLNPCAHAHPCAAQIDQGARWDHRASNLASLTALKLPAPLS